MHLRVKNTQSKFTEKFKSTDTGIPLSHLFNVLNLTLNKEKMFEINCLNCPGKVISNSLCIIKPLDKVIDDNGNRC